MDQQVALIHTQHWLKSRRNTTIICILYAFLVGVEYSAISVSLLFYLQKFVPDISGFGEYWYSIVMTACAFSSSIFGVISGRYIDRTRRFKECLLTFAGVTIVGNLIYTIHQSVWFLIIGRFLCGVIDATQPVISSELSRLYKGAEQTSVLAKYQVSYSIGFVIGPLTALVFAPIHFQIGEWIISQENFIGVFMAVLHFIVMLFAIFGVSNLSRKDTIDSTKNGGAKENNSTNIKFNPSSEQIPNVTINSNKNDVDKSTIIDSTKDTGNDANLLNWTLKDIFKNFDLVLLCISSAFCNYISVVTEIMVNIKASIDFKWSLARLGVITSIGIVLYMICLLTFGKIVMERTIRGSYLTCFIVSILTTLSLIIPELVQIVSLVNQTTLVCIVLFLNTFTGFACVILAWKLLFEMVPERSSSYCEGLRSFVSWCFGVAAFLTSSWISNEAKIVLPVLACIITLLTVLLVLRKHFRPRCFPCDEPSTGEKAELS